VWVGVVHTIFEAAQKEMITGPISEVLWKLIQQDTATKHIMHGVQDDTCCT